MKYAKSVEEFFTRESPHQVELLSLRKILLSSGLDEKLKWGAPAYCYKGKNVVGIGSFKSYFGLWFFQGGLLKDKDRKLMNAQEGKTKAMRQWRMSSKKEIDKKLILAYVTESVKNFEAGKEIKSAKPIKKALKIEGLLKTALSKNKSFKAKFDTLTPGKQKEYAEYISEAKRDATKESRLEKIKPMIMKGEGLNDAYK